MYGWAHRYTSSGGGRGSSGGVAFLSGFSTSRQGGKPVTTHNLPPQTCKNWNASRGLQVIQGRQGSYEVTAEVAAPREDGTVLLSNATPALSNYLFLEYPGASVSVSVVRAGSKELVASTMLVSEQ